MDRILIIGARGHAGSVADVIAAEGKYAVAGLIDSFQDPGTACWGCTVLGGEDDLPELCHDLQITGICIAIGDNFQRRAMWHRIRSAVPVIELVTTIHPSAVIGSDVSVGSGTVIMPGATIIRGSRIGGGCLINTGATLDHNGMMTSWSSLGPGVVAGGNVSLGTCTAVCIGVVLSNRVTVGDYSVIGAGSVVLDDLPAGVLAYGTPCRTVRKRHQDQSYL